MMITPAPPEERRADVPQDVISSDMRGGETLAIIFPKNAEPREGISVNERKYVWRGALYETGTSMPLTDAEWQTLTTAIDQWCAALPQFRELAPDEPRYSVNIRCSWMSTNTRFFRVPVDQVPPELMMLIEKEPVSLQYRSTCIQRKQHISGERYATGLVSLW
jgi:hypothetical protein